MSGNRTSIELTQEERQALWDAYEQLAARIAEDLRDARVILQNPVELDLRTIQEWLERAEIRRFERTRQWTRLTNNTVAAMRGALKRGD